MYSLITNTLYNIKDYNNSIYNLIDDSKVILVLDFLYRNITMENTIKFTLEELITDCGYKTNSKKNNINKEFINILVKLQNMGLIGECNVDMNKLSLKTYCKIKSVNLVEKIDDKYYDFFIINDIEKSKIMQVKEVNNSKLLLYYGLLKSMMYKRPEGQSSNYPGAKAESCYPPFENIKKYIGLSADMINKYNKILVDLDLIRYDTAGCYYYKIDSYKKLYESNNTYVLFKDGWEEELKKSIKFFFEKNEDSRVFTHSRKYKNNDKKINGYIGAINRLEKEGKAKPEQIAKRNQYINSNKLKDSKQFQIKSLLENKEYKDMLLSDIFEYKGFNNYAEEYKGIEDDLLLVDEDDKLLVDKDYYEWIMVNYTREDHDKFVNYVKKYKRDHNIVKCTWGSPEPSILDKKSEEKNNIVSFPQTEGISISKTDNDDNFFDFEDTKTIESHNEKDSGDEDMSWLEDNEFHSTGALKDLKELNNSMQCNDSELDYYTDDEFEYALDIGDIDTIQECRMTPEQKTKYNEWYQENVVPF